MRSALCVECRGFSANRRQLDAAAPARRSHPPPYAPPYYYITPTHNFSPISHFWHSLPTPLPTPLPHPSSHCIDIDTLCINIDTLCINIDTPYLVVVVVVVVVVEIRGENVGYIGDITTNLDAAPLMPLESRFTSLGCGDTICLRYER